MPAEMVLDFEGGLNTARHSSKIEDNELSAMVNAVVLDGTVRLDRRYIKKAASPVASPTVHGSGYGMYGDRSSIVTNDATEQYIVAMSGDLYMVDLTAATLAFVKVQNSVYPTDVANINKNWFFQQFGQYLYGCQTNYGFGRKLIGPGTDTTGNWGKLTRPAAPVAAPTQVFEPTSQKNLSTLFGTATLSNISPAASASSISSSQVSLTWAAGKLGDLSFDINFASQDWTYQDTLSLINSLDWDIGTNTRLSLKSVELKSPLETSGYTAALIPWMSPDANLTYFRTSNIARATKAQITGMRITLNIAATSTIALSARFIPPLIWGVWLSIASDVNPGNTFPTLAKLTYDYTYYNSATGFESLPSPDVVIVASAQNVYGEWRTITMVGTGASGTDKLRLYRVVTNADGSISRYRIAELTNAVGNITFTDKRPLEEVTALATYTPSVIPTSGFTALGGWQDRLCIAAAGIVYISRQGDPLSFEPLGSSYNPYDPARGRTFYPDDTRSENILGLCGQDALYIVTDKSVRAVYGSSVDDWNLVKLATAEGADSYRAWWPYKNGVLVLTNSGRLLYLNVGRMEPFEISTKLRPRMGNTGLTGCNVVAVRPDGEIECRASTRRYFLMDVNGNWRSGVHTHATHSVLFVPNQPVRWIGTDGNLYEGGNDTYLTDGGTTGANGTAVTWSVSTKSFQAPRERIREIFYGDTPQTVDPVDTTKALYPKATILGEGGNVLAVLTFGDKTARVPVDAKGSTMRFTFEGDKDTILQDCRVRFEDLGRLANK